MRLAALTRIASISVPFLASTFFLIAQPVWLIADGQILAASSLLFAWGLGQLLGSVLLATVLKRQEGRRTVGKVASLVVVLIAAGSTVLSLTDASVTWFVIFAFIAGSCWSAFQVTVRTIYGSWGEIWARRGSALGRVGAATGSAVYPVIVLTTDSIWAGSLLVLGVLLSPIFLHKNGNYRRPVVEAEGRTADARRDKFVLTDNLFLVWGAYGLVAVHVVIISLAASVEWVSGFTPLLAVGALIAPSLAAFVPMILKRDLSGWLVLTTAANLSWFLLLIHPAFVLVIALFTGLMFFVVEGSADWESYKRGRVSELVLGRAIGSNLSGVTMLTLVAALQNEPFTLIAVYVGLGVMVTVAYLVVRRGWVAARG